jgi:hypothetical protein
MPPCHARSAKCTSSYRSGGPRPTCRRPFRVRARHPSCRS